MCAVVGEGLGYQMLKRGCCRESRDNCELFQTNQILFKRVLIKRCKSNFEGKNVRIKRLSYSLHD